MFVDVATWKKTENFPSGRKFIKSGKRVNELSDVCSYKDTNPIGLMPSPYDLI